MSELKPWVMVQAFQRDAIVLIVPRSRIRERARASHEPVLQLPWPVDAQRLGQAVMETIEECRWEIQPDLQDISETDLPRLVGAKNWKEFAKATKLVNIERYLSEAASIDVISSQYVQGGGFYSTIHDEEVLEPPVTALDLGEAILRAFDRCTRFESKAKRKN